MKKSFIFLLSTLILICSCTSKYEKGLKALKKADIYGERLEYYLEYGNQKSDPVSFANEIIRGDYDNEIRKWFPKSGRVSIHAALNQGWIMPGMTYEEIKEVVGSARSTSRTNGVVQFAYYPGVQLCFSGGIYTHWNDSYY